MTNKRVAKHPLLYIDQPTVNAPKASMQSTYQSSLNEKAELVTPKGKGRTIRSRPKNVPAQQFSLAEATKESVSNENNQVKEKDNSREEINALKFKEMSILQKINYFSNVPTHIPKLKCEIKTRERSFRGVITSFDDENVFVRIGKRIKPTTILIEDIKDIKMLGF